MITESDGFIAEEIVRDSLVKFSDMPCIKKVHRDKKASVHWSAARRKKRFSSR